MYSQLLVLLGLVSLSAIFSAGELALIAITNSKVSDLVSSKVPSSKLLANIKKNPHKLLITVLITKNVIDIGASAYAAVVFTGIFGDSGLGIATGIMTLMILVFGDIVPKTFATQHMAGVALFMARPIWILQIVLYPAVWFLELISKLTNKIFGAKTGYTVTEGELIALLKMGAQEGTIEKQEREFIENVLEFNDIEAGEIMTPRVAIEALDADMTIQEAVDFVIKHTHSRIPVYKDSIDHIIGVISIKELLRFFDTCPQNKKLGSLNLTPPLEVPFSKKIDKLFREFQRKHIHIAIVIDEHGGTDGLITMEDLLEEIVGDIVDEHDMDTMPIQVLDSKNVIASGETWVEDINDFFKVKFSENDHDTLNTVLTEHLHRFPREGEVILFPRVRVQVLSMNKNTVGRVKLTKRRRRTKV